MNFEALQEGAGHLSEEEEGQEFLKGAEQEAPLVLLHSLLKHLPLRTSPLPRLLRCLLLIRQLLQ